MQTSAAVILVCASSVHHPQGPWLVCSCIVRDSLSPKHSLPRQRRIKHLVPSLSAVPTLVVRANLQEIPAPSSEVISLKQASSTVESRSRSIDTLLHRDRWRNDRTAVPTGAHQTPRTLPVGCSHTWTKIRILAAAYQARPPRLLST